MKSVAKVVTTGQMRKLMKEAGTRIKWMATVSYVGRTVKAMKVNLLMTNVKAKVLSSGQMAVNILVNGKEVSSMERAPTLTKKAK